MSGQYRRARPRHTTRDDPGRMMGRPPSVSDAELVALLPATVAGLARRVGLDRSTVYERLRSLEVEGRVRCDRGANTHIWHRDEPPRPPAPAASAVDAWLTTHRGGHL